MLLSIDKHSYTSILLSVALSVLLAAICWQDVRERQVSLWILLLLFGGCLGRFLLMEESYVFPLINSSFLLLQGGVILLYLWMRYRTARVSKYCGAGDVMFWVACLWCFSPLNFLLFFVVSLVGALAFHLLLRQWLQHYQSIYIPLAGFQGLFLTAALALELLLPQWNTYNDFHVLNTLGLL